MELIALPRSSIEPEAGIAVLLSTQDGLPGRFETELREVIQEAHRVGPVVRVFALDNAIAPILPGDE